MNLPEVGQLVAEKYRITRLIGQGGMGAIFAAEHTLLAREVAIKLLLSESYADPNAVNRFLNEARAAARIDGEHVVRVLDVGIAEGNVPYIAMELLEGEDLSEVLEANGPMPPKVVADYVLQALHAIGQAHAMGIVHRDLKPSNLFLAVGADGTRTIKVLDFGIAKVTLGDKAQQALTTTNNSMGSPVYMSPEQFRSAKSVDPSSDVWAIGVVLYELLTGSMPFNGDSFAELMLAIMEGTPPPVHTVRRGIPPAFGGLVSLCLAKDRTQRLSVVQLARALAPFAGSAGPPLAERIAATASRVAAKSGSGQGPNTQVSAAPQANPSQSLTKQSWASTAAPALDASKRRWILPAAIGGGVALLGAITAVVLAVRSHSAPVTASASPGNVASIALTSTSTATATAALTIPAPPIAAAEPLHDAGSSTAATAPASETQHAPAHGTHTGSTHGGTPATAPPTTAPARPAPASSGFSRDKESF